MGGSDPLAGCGPGFAQGGAAECVPVGGEAAGPEVGSWGTMVMDGRVAGQGPKVRLACETIVRASAAVPARHPVVWLLIVAGMLGVAWGRRALMRPTHPVRGSVWVAGEPAAGALVIFHRPHSIALAGDRPWAEVRKDGSFDLTTRLEADGAPAGEYAVTIRWLESLEVCGESVAGLDFVPGDYSMPDTTPLRAVVREGANRLPPLLVERRGHEVE